MLIQKVRPAELSLCSKRLKIWLGISDFLLLKIQMFLYSILFLILYLNRVCCVHKNSVSNFNAEKKASIVFFLLHSSPFICWLWNERKLQDFISLNIPVLLPALFHYCESWTKETGLRELRQRTNDQKKLPL